MRAWREQLNHLLDQRAESERTRIERELVGLDLGKVEDLLDQREQRLAGVARGLDVGGLLGRERRVEQEVGHAEDAVERCANLVRHHGEEARLGAARRLRGIACFRQRVLGLGAVGDVAADALNFGAAVLAPHHHVAPSEPARAVAGRDLLVVHPRAVGEHVGLALFEHGKRGGGAQERGAVLAGERAEGVVGVADAALAIAPYDQVALRLEQARGTLLGFLQLPHVVGKLLATGGGAAQRNALALVARGHHQDDAAGDGEEPTDADREQRRIVDRFVDVVEMLEQDRGDGHRANREKGPACDAQDVPATDVDTRARFPLAGTNLHVTRSPGLQACPGDHRRPVLVSFRDAVWP